MGRARVWDAYLSLVQSLTAAELVELPPNQGYRHASSAVLLAGSMGTPSSHCALDSAAAGGAGGYLAPSAWCCRSACRRKSGCLLATPLGVTLQARGVLRWGDWPGAGLHF